MTKKDAKQLLFENMSKLNPDFKLQEVAPQPAQPVATQPVAPQVIQPTDVKSLNRANQTSKSVQNASKRINTSREFPEAFRVWFSGLGYKPNNPAVSIARVKMEIEKVMKSMGYR